MQGAIERAVHCVDSVDAFDSGALVFRSCETHRDVYASDYEDIVFQFDFASYLGCEFVVACIDLTRFQRASESAHHSAGGSGDDVVDGSGVRFLNFVWRDFVVLSDCAVHAEYDRLRFAGQMRNADRATFTFDLDV